MKQKITIFVTLALEIFDRTYPGTALTCRGISSNFAYQEAPMHTLQNNWKPGRFKQAGNLLCLGLNNLCMMKGLSIVKYDI